MKKINATLGLIVLLVIGLRVALPPILLTEVNKRLNNLSPYLTGEVRDLDLRVIRGEVVLNDLRLAIKDQKEDFLKLGEIDISVPWRKIFKDRTPVSIGLTDGSIRYTDDLPEKLKKVMNSVSRNSTGEKEKAPKFYLSDISWMSLEADYVSAKVFSNKGPLKIKDVSGYLRNIASDKKNPKSPFVAEGKSSGRGEFKLNGELGLLAKPIQWDMDLQLKSFELVSLNSLLYQRVPFTFNKGTLDLYAEAKAKGKRIDGYVKPFMNHMGFISSNENFKNSNHWFFEVIAAVGNWVVEAKDASVATKIPFHYDGHDIKVDTGEAIGKIIEHGFDKELIEGVDEDFKLQAEEAKH